MARLEQLNRDLPTSAVVPVAGEEGALGGAALEGHGLTKSYGGRIVVNKVEVCIGKGEVVGLLGPNGAGKTTTFYMLVGLLKPDAGTIALGGKDITMLPLYQRA